MATGTGNLPASNDSTSPFQILTSEQMNNIKANIDALADGSGIGDGSVASDKIDFTTPEDRYFSTVFGITATGTLDITGAGFKPSKVTVISQYNDPTTARFCTGTAVLKNNGTISQMGTGIMTTGTTNVVRRTDFLVGISASGLATTLGSVQSFLSDGVRLNITARDADTTDVWFVTMER